MNKRTFSRLTAVGAVVATFMAAALMASAQDAVGNGTTPTNGVEPRLAAPDMKLPAKYAPLDIDTLIVFADAESGDLWVTDAEGSGFVRLTHTAVIESDPSAWFPWVVYEAEDKYGNSDIYMTSLVSKLELGSAGRIKISGNKSNDWDPTILGVDPYGPTSTATEAPNGDTRARRPELRSIFGDAFIAYSSDRKDGNKNHCGIEIFAEWFTVTGPMLASECDGIDKFDPEFSLFGQYIAYTGMKGNGDTEIWVGGGGIMSSPMPPVRVTGGAGNPEHPTWAPNSFPGGTARPDVLQPAGDYPITYSKGGALWTMTATAQKTLSDDADLLSPEWNALGEAILFVKAKGQHSAVAWWAGAGIKTVTPHKFWVTGADFMAPTFPV